MSKRKKKLQPPTEPYVPITERMPLDLGGSWLRDIDNHHIIAFEVDEYRTLTFRFAALQALMHECDRLRQFANLCVATLEAHGLSAEDVVATLKDKEEEVP